MAWYKFGFGKKNDSTLNTGTAIILDEVGTPSTKVFKIISNPKDEFVILDFGSNEHIKVKSRHIRRKRILIYKLPSGKVITQNPEQWKNIPLDEYGIKELRFNLQNFGIQEGRAALNRWTLPEDLVSKLAPWFKLMVIGIVVGVLGWFILKFGGQAISMVTSARTLDCASILPHAQIPIEINATSSPIG